MAKKVIIDTDPGIDDSVALALAVNSPELEIMAVTTLFGNSTAENTFRNARYVLAKFGASRIPVFPGAAAPLIRRPEIAAETHGESGLGYLVAEEPFGQDAGSVLQQAGAARFAPLAILDLLAKSGEKVTILALGPQTNLALALACDRELMRSKVAEIVLMGGSAGAPGNTTPVSEFNFWADPEAAQAVLQSGIPIRMVGLDVTRSIVFHNSLVEKLRASGSERARFLAELMRFYVDFHREYERLDGCIVNDPLAVALAIDGRFGMAQPMYVEVCCTDGLTRGQSICDRFGFLKKEPNAGVYLSVDAAAVIEFTLERAVGRVVSPEDIARGLELAKTPYKHG